jgi:hypothetical protein
MWNDIRDQFRERLPAIIDLAMYMVFVTTVAGVLLGLSWLYIEHGMVLFLMGFGAIIVCAILNERRGMPHTGSGGPWEAFGDSRPPVAPVRQTSAPGAGGGSDRPQSAPVAAGAEKVEFALRGAR